MVQRHQLFVIAKVAGHYQYLAAVHHQWLYGVSALQQCLLLLRIFSTEANWPAIRQELAYAEEYYRDRGPPKERPTLSWRVREAPRFPFIQTALMVGAGYDIVESSAKIVIIEPFGMGYDQGDNNDGITVLDITDLTQVKYCFVNFMEPYFEEQDGPSEDDRRKMASLHKPLTGWEYLLTYYDKDDILVQNNISVPESLDAKPLIDLKTLAETWPWGEWNIKVESEETKNSSQSLPNQPPSLVDQSIAKVVDAALSSNDFDYRMLDESIQSIPYFQNKLRRCLITREANRVGASAASAPLLKLAYANQDHLDWEVFKNISVECIKAALSGSEMRKTRSINISGTSAAQPGIGDALSVHGGIEVVYALDKPTRETENVTIQMYSDLTTARPIPNLKKLVLSSPLSMAIPPFSWLPTGAPTLSAFPIVQLLIYNKNGLSSNDPEVPAMEYYFLGDALLSPVRAVTSFFRYLESWKGSMQSRWQGTALQAVKCFATGSSTLGVSQDVEIGPFPAETYNYAKALFHTNYMRGCYPEMRDLVPGQWTILLYPSSLCDEGHSLKVVGRSATHLDLGFNYAFVRSKSLIKATAKENDHMPADIETADLEEFLQQTVPGMDTSKLQEHKDVLIRQIYGNKLSDEEVRRLRPNILKRLSAGQASDLLKQFIANLANVERKRRSSRIRPERVPIQSEPLVFVLG